MEEISSAIAAPFMLGNLIYEESVRKPCKDISGIQVISKSTSLSESNLNNLPSVSTSGENKLYNEVNRGGAHLLKVVTENRKNLNSRDKIYQEFREDSLKSLEIGPLLDGFCSQAVARDTSRIGREELVALESNSVTILSTVLDFEKNDMLGSNAEAQTVGDIIDMPKNEEVMSCNQHKKILSSPPQEPSEADKSRTEKQIHPSGFNCGALWGFTSISGRNSEMEDAVVALPFFLQIPTHMLNNDTVAGSMSQTPTQLTAHYFGVYDGHGGRQVANFCRERMHLALAEEIEIAKVNLHNGNVGYNWQEQWEKSLLSCFRTVDAEVGGIHNGNRGTGEDDGSSKTIFAPVAPEAVGSTAVVAIICSTHIVVANCGDSRAVLCRRKSPIPLSVDHKPNREDEHARIEAAGGKVINWDGFRVSGVLAMSRSIGDRYLKPYVIPDPEMMFVPRSKEDELLVLASDGLWDVMTNEEVCDVARRRILLWHKKNGMMTMTSRERGHGIDPAAQDAADYLSKLALHKGSKDNISVIVVDLKAQRKLKKKTNQ